MGFLKKPFVKILLAAALGGGADAGVSVLSDPKTPLDGKALGKAVAIGALSGILYGKRSPISEVLNEVPNGQKQQKP